MTIPPRTRPQSLGRSIPASLNCTFSPLNKNSAVLCGFAILLLTDTVRGTPRYIQSNYATPQTSQATVTLPYTSTQAAGDLNLAVVGWNDLTSQVTAVTDSNRNVYQLAVGPTRGNGVSQAIFYAKNIVAASAGSNAVKITFNAAASFPNIRILT
jgi:hypothetical protein